MWRCNFSNIKILKAITSVNKNFKFITNCIIMQKADCGLNLSGSCYWDNEVDGTVTVKWDSASLICVVNVFGCALWLPTIDRVFFTISIIYFFPLRWIFKFGLLKFLFFQHYSFITSIFRISSNFLSKLLPKLSKYICSPFCLLYLVLHCCKKLFLCIPSLSSSYCCPDDLWELILPS